MLRDPSPRCTSCGRRTPPSDTERPLKARLVSLDEGLNVFALPDNCPNRGEPPADERPAEEQIDEEDGRSPLVLPDVGDHGGHEVGRHHGGEGDDQDEIESRVVRQVKIHK
jgi:hypothetical protein